MQFSLTVSLTLAPIDSFGRHSTRGLFIYYFAACSITVCTSVQNNIRSMSVILGKLNSILLEEHFGINARIVGDCLFSAIQSRTHSAIVKSTGLTRNEVSHALTTLIKFRLVKFGPATDGNVVEYTIIPHKVYLLVGYSKYVQYIHKKCGELAGLIITELQRVGSDIATNLIIRCLNAEIAHDKLTELRDEFLKLVELKYVVRAPALKVTQDRPVIPEFEIDEHSFFKEPDIELSTLIQLKNGENVEPTDKDTYWFVNFDRLHQEFRDLIMIDAMHRTIDSTAADCLRCMLELMYARTNAWQAVTNPISYAEIRQSVERNQKRKPNPKLSRQLDQYISVICDDKLKFVSKFSESAGGQYVFQMKHAIEQLTFACIESIVEERFGKKAGRIFRIVRHLKYCDQDEIQKEAMVGSKEAKLYTYRLLEENFFEIKPIRKSGTGGRGVPKTFFLFSVNQSQIVSMLLENCYKTLFNCLTRVQHIKNENRRIIDKSQRLEMIVRAMKDRGQSAEYIQEISETFTPPEKEQLASVNARCKNLRIAGLGIDNTIFLLQLYQDYQQLK